MSRRGHFQTGLHHSLYVTLARLLPSLSDLHDSRSTTEMHQHGSQNIPDCVDVLLDMSNKV